LPLLAYRIKTALSLSEQQHVWLSTDSKDYAQLGENYGATVPFLRPQQLSTDTARSSDVILHAMQVAEDMNLRYGYIGLLEPTSPFVYYEDLRKALAQLHSDEKADAIVAVKEVRTNTSFVQDDSYYLEELARKLETIKNSNRQNFSRQITPSGGFYIGKWESFKKNMTFYTEKCMSYLLPWECELEIDEPQDWLWAEMLLEKKIVNLNKVFAK